MKPDEEVGEMRQYIKALEEALEGLMDVAEQAMPDSYFQTDSRVVKARTVLSKRPRWLVTT